MTMMVLLGMRRWVCWVVVVVVVSWWWWRAEGAIVLEGASILGGRLDTGETVTLSAGTYVANGPDSLVVDHPNAILRLEAGVSIRFGPGIGIQVRRGRLQSRGASTAESVTLSPPLGDGSMTTPPASWGGIELAASAADGASVLRHTQLRAGNLTLVNTRVQLESVSVRSGGLISGTVQGDVEWKDVSVVLASNRIPPPPPGILLEAVEGNVQLSNGRTEECGTVIRRVTGEVLVEEWTVREAPRDGLVLADIQGNVQLRNLTISNTGRPVRGAGDGMMGGDTDMMPGGGGNVIGPGGGGGMGMGKGKGSGGKMGPPPDGGGGPPPDGGGPPQRGRRQLQSSDSGVSSDAGRAGLVVRNVTGFVVLENSQLRRNRPRAILIEEVSGGTEVRLESTSVGGTTSRCREMGVSNADLLSIGVDCTNEEQVQATQTAVLLASIDAPVTISKCLLEDNNVTSVLRLQNVQQPVEVRDSLLLKNAQAHGIVVARTSSPVTIAASRLCAEGNGQFFDIFLEAAQADVTAQANAYGGCCSADTQVSSRARIDSQRIYDDDEDEALPAVQFRQLSPSEDDLPTVPEMACTSRGEQDGPRNTLTCAVGQVNFKKKVKTHCSFQWLPNNGDGEEETNVFGDSMEIAGFDRSRVDETRYYMVTASRQLHTLQIVTSKKKRCAATLLQTCTLPERDMERVESLTVAGTSMDASTEFVELLFLQQGIVFLAQYDPTLCLPSMGSGGMRAALPPIYAYPGAAFNDNLMPENSAVPPRGGFQALTSVLAEGGTMMPPPRRYRWLGTAQALTQDFSGSAFNFGDPSPSRLLQIQSRVVESEFIYLNDAATIRADLRLSDLAALNQGGGLWALESAPGRTQLYAMNVWLGAASILGQPVVQNFPPALAVPKQVVWSSEEDASFSVVAVATQTPKQSRLVLARPAAAGVDFMALHVSFVEEDFAQVLVEQLLEQSARCFAREATVTFWRKRLQQVRKKFLLQGNALKIFKATELLQDEALQQEPELCLDADASVNCCQALLDMVQRLVEWTRLCLA